MKRNLVGIFFIILAAQACLTEPDCVDTTTDFINLRFYEAETGEQDTLLFLTVRALGSDSLFAQLDTLSRLQLPLDRRNSEVTYVFDTNIGRDTLVINYNLGTRMISEECGVEYIFTELGYLRNDFDSINIVNKTPLEEINEDVQIYN